MEANTIEEQLINIYNIPQLMITNLHKHNFSVLDPPLTLEQWSNYYHRMMLSDQSGNIHEKDIIEPQFEIGWMVGELFTPADVGILPKAHLTKYHLSCANLKNLNLYKTKFTDVNLVFAEADNTNFDKTEFKHSCLNTIRSRYSSFRKAKLNFVNAVGANFSFANFYKADLRNSNFLNADFTGATLIKADLTNTNLRHTKVKDADFTGAKVGPETHIPGWEVTPNGLQRIHD